MLEIKLLKPRHGSLEEHQVFLWPHAAANANLGAEKTPAQPAFSYFFSWEPLNTPGSAPVYDLVMSKEREFRDAFWRKNIRPPEGTVPEANILNLEIGTVYYWKVLAKISGRLVGMSPARFFRTDPGPPRWMHVPGMYNVRDIGGWPLEKNRRIRQGLIYRSSELAGTSWNITAEGERVLIEDLNIRTDLDLRGSDGTAAPVLRESAVRWLNVPVSAYHVQKESNREGYRRVFGIFADSSNYPVIFHCQGGCDRGGTVAFLLQALLGLDRGALIREYELSNRASSWKEFRALLDGLSVLGGVRKNLKAQTENYLMGIGVSAKEIGAIRSSLIEPCR